MAAIALPVRLDITHLDPHNLIFLRFTIRVEHFTDLSWIVFSLQAGEVKGKESRTFARSCGREMPDQPAGSATTSDDPTKDPDYVGR